MLNNKLYLLFLLAIAMLCSCRIQTMPFKSEKIDTVFFKNVTRLWGFKTAQDFDTITIYRAVLQEELVDRDGIPEFKLINEESNQSTADIVGGKNYHELYLCQLHIRKTNVRLCVYIASSFNVDSICTKLGPAYLGSVSMEQFNIKKGLKITQTKDSTFFISEASPSKLLFIAEQSIPVGNDKICDSDEPDDSKCVIRIKEIINSNINKIGGKKPTLYFTQKIFSDPDALLFKYYKTIIK